MGLIITKLQNDNVEVTSTDVNFQPYALQPDLSIYRNKAARIDGATVIGIEKIRNVFRYTKVDQVVRKDGTTVLITDGDTLYNELKEHFFYISDADGGGITEGYTLFLETWQSFIDDSYDLNTANEINIALTDTITFDDLTGITITSQLGTGTLSVVGNTLECTVAGTSRYVLLSNGVELIYSEGSNRFIYYSGGIAELSSGITWNNGVDTTWSTSDVKSQTGVQSFNTYDNFVTYSNTFHRNDGDWGWLNSGRIENNKTESDPLGGAEASTLQFRTSNPLSGIAQGVIPFTGNRTVSVWAKSYDVVGKKFRIRVDGVSVPLESDDFTTSATWQKFSFDVVGNGMVANVYIINEVAGTDGFIDIFGCSFFETDNPSEYIETVTETAVNVIVKEDSNDLGNDCLSNPIQRDVLVDGYNLSGNNSHLDTKIVDRTGAGTDGIWFKVMVNDLPMVICGDDVMEMRVNASNLFEVEFNGVTLVSNQVINKEEWYFAKFGQDGAANGFIWIGKENVSPTLNASGTVGAATAASIIMTFGK